MANDYYTASEETKEPVLIPWQGGPAWLLNELLWNTSRVILPLGSCQVAICYAYFTVTYIDFTLSTASCKVVKHSRTFQNDIYRCNAVLQLLLKLLCIFYSDECRFHTVVWLLVKYSRMFQNDIYRCNAVLQLLVKLLCMLQNDIFIDVILFYGFWSS